MLKLKKSWRLYGDLFVFCLCMVNMSLFVNIAMFQKKWGYIFIAIMWVVVGVRWLWDAISRLIDRKLDITE
jgi:Na+/melibiose symporter-like transporter